jgi:hypothetical protein
MKRTTLTSLLLLTTLLLTACGAASPALLSAKEVPSVAGGRAASQDFAQPEMAPQVGSDASGTDAFASPGSSTASAANRLVIRNATLSLVVNDPADSIDKFTRMAEGMNGYVVSSNVYQTAYGVDASGQTRMINQANITLRVPSDRLDDALAQIKVASLEVRSETVTGQDVTEEYTDLQSQLRNLESAEAQLREIMQNAQKTEDVLQVFEQLKQVRQQIEVTKGRMNYLEGSAKMSEISLDLIPDVAAEPVQVGPWSPVGTAKAAVRALIQALQSLADAAIWGAICVLPVAVIFGLPAFIVIRRWLRNRRETADEKAAA